MVDDTATIDVICDYKSTIGDITANGIDDLDIKPELHAAILLQRWWRRVTEHMSDSEFKYDVYNTDDDEAEEGYSDDNGNDSLSCHNRDFTNYESDPSIAEPEFFVESQQHARTPALNLTYGTEADAIRMRQWLNDHALPQGVADTFLTSGARSIDDICILLAPGTDSTDSEFVQEILSKFTPLDRFKLGNLVKSMSSSTTENDAGDLAPKIASHEQWKLGSERAVPTIPGSDVVMADAWSTVDETAVTTQTPTAVTTQTPCTPINNDGATLDVMSDHNSTIDDSSRVANDHELRDDVYSDDDYDDYLYN
jgi:hypothetical protein